jgi:hypothetical protein
LDSFEISAAEIVPDGLVIAAYRDSNAVVVANIICDYHIDRIVDEDAIVIIARAIVLADNIIVAERNDDPPHRTQQAVVVHQGVIVAV